MNKNQTSKLRFHWMLPKAGEVQEIGKQTEKEAAQYRLNAARNSTTYNADIDGWKNFAIVAEEAGIEGVLISFSTYEPDPVAVAASLGMVTEKLKFILAFRSGLMQPPAMVQQINTLSGLINGRILLNTVAGSSISEQQSYGDFLSHDERYDRASEFLTVCNQLWRSNDEVNFEGRYYKVTNAKVHPEYISPDREVPEMFVSGHSAAAQNLAVTQGTCWLRVIDTPEKIAPMVAEIKAKGIEVCLRFGIVCRPTKEEAIKVLDEILELAGDDINKATASSRQDSKMFQEASNTKENLWYNDTIYAGFAPHFGPVWTMLVGTPDEIVDALMEYKKIGVTQFIISGFPEIDEVQIFGKEVLPLLRKAEQKLKDPLN